MAEYKLLKTEGRAKRAEFHTVHGTIQTPVFMNVGTCGAIKGAVSAHDLKEIGCQIELSNTYHLHLRPGDDVVRQMGGLHKFMDWDGPMLTDSGGFQVFSLAGLRKIKEEGVYFFEQHGEADPLPEDFSGWTAYALHDGVAHATTAHRSFCRMERTPEGGIRFPEKIMAAGCRCSVYAVDQTGAMRVAEVRLPKPRPTPEQPVSQAQEKPAE